MFVRRHPSIATSGKKEWFLKNVGSGCAMNIVLGDKLQGGEWKTTKLYPLQCNESISVEAGRQAGNTWAATYSGIFGNSFTTICTKNRNAIAKGNEYPCWNPMLEEQDWKRKD